MAASSVVAVPELWRVARRVADQLKRRGFRSIAVSGSLARGDAGPGSDVDLWAIGPGSDRDERTVEGVAVTVFSSRPEELYDLPWLNRWDVDRLVVLEDGGGHFAGLFRRWPRLRPRLRAQWAANARAAQAHARAMSRLGPRDERTLAARRLVWLEFATAVWRATETKVPKWRHAKALLSPRALAALRRRLALPRSIDRDAWLKQVRRAPRAAASLMKEPVPRWAGAEAHLRHGEVEEAVLKVRADLDAWLAIPLRHAHAGIDVAAFLDREAPPLGRLFRAAQALPRGKRRL